MNEKPNNSTPFSEPSWNLIRKTYAGSFPTLEEMSLVLREITEHRDMLLEHPLPDSKKQTPHQETT